MLGMQRNFLQLRPTIRHFPWQQQPNYQRETRAVQETARGDDGNGNDRADVGMGKQIFFLQEQGVGVATKSSVRGVVVTGVILLEAHRPTILQSATTPGNSLPICAKSTRNLSCTGSSRKGQRRRSGRGLVFSSFFLLVCLMLLLVHFLLFADFWLIHCRFYFLKMKMKKA